MQESLVNPKITADKIFTLNDYKQLNINEFLLYSDNILEGITLLNLLTRSNNLLSFYGVIYEPIDQPIYIFKDDKERYYSIKICGAFDKWNLPDIVDRIKHFVDLPDYIFYSVSSKKTILAGESTETASVGNSQWQREGRKVAAARNGVPFIYQTFYSGKDESQDTIREPNSLQVYNQLLYSIRYRTPSIVAYFENNFEGSCTRERTPKDSQDIFELYVKSILLADVDSNYIQTKQKLEKDFFKHMLSYILEGKYSSSTKEIEEEPRLNEDFPVINDTVKNAIFYKMEDFINDVVDYIYTGNESFILKYPIDDLNESLLKTWSYSRQWLSDLLSYLSQGGKPALKYTTKKAKVGIADLSLCKKFLINKFPAEQSRINEILDDTKFNEAIIFPSRIHKISNGKLTFAPDPESGEIVAFCELFGYDYKQQKKRPIIGYGIVKTPDDFDFNSKVGTKLYKAIANYIDILILDNSKLIMDFSNNYQSRTNVIPVSILGEKPTGLTEEMAIVSTYLNQTTIRSNWQLCFIHTHHSSWQQLVIHNPKGEIAQQKIDRVSTKVDLIMQNEEIFMVAEGKNDYFSFFSDEKIQTAMKEASKIIAKLYSSEYIKFDTFIYNLPTNPDPDYYIKIEYDKVKGAIDRGHFSKVAFEKDFVIIIVYIDKNNNTSFKLVYSNNFNTTLKNQLDREFNQ